MLLMDHPIDRRGPCGSCRRPGAVFGPRWRRCRVYGKANVWLHQPDEALLLRLLGPGVGLVLVHQYLGQLTAVVNTAVLGTSGTQVVFKVEYDDARHRTTGRVATLLAR